VPDDPLQGTGTRIDVGSPRFDHPGDDLGHLLRGLRIGQRAGIGPSMPCVQPELGRDDTRLLPEGTVRVLLLWGVVVMLSVALLLVPLLRRDRLARVLAGRSAPRRVRVLAPGAVPVQVSRPDERTLLDRPEGGFLGQPFDGVFRSRAHPMRTGERVVLTGVEIEVTALTADGRPGEIAVRFAVPLEDGSVRWLRWDEKGGYAESRSPAVGERMVVQATKVQF
jgi:hypothetical protein